MINGYMRAAKLVIPASRSIIAKELSARYRLKEQQIAGYLDVAQAAVSKYLKGNYSNRIKEIEAQIDRKPIEEYIRKIAEGRKEYANVAICTICSRANAFSCKFSKAVK